MILVAFSMAAAQSTKTLIEGLVDGVNVTIRDEFVQEREEVLSQQADLGNWNAEDDRVDPVHAPHAVCIDIEGDGVNEGEIHEMVELFA